MLAAFPRQGGFGTLPAYPAPERRSLTNSGRKRRFLGPFNRRRPPADCENIPIAAHAQGIEPGSVR